MSDSEFESSPEDPWITQDKLVGDSFPMAVDVETGEERDIEEMADPTRQGDVPSPSPVKSRTSKKTDEEKWEEYLEAYDELNKLKNKYDKKIQQHKRDFKKKNPNASKQERKEALSNIGKSAEITRFKGLGEISPKEFKQFIGPNMRLEPVILAKEDKIQDLLQYFMGKNTKERQSFIIDNLRVEEEFLPHN